MHGCDNWSNWRGQWRQAEETFDGERSVNKPDNNDDGWLGGSECKRMYLVESPRCCSIIVGIDEG